MFGVLLISVGSMWLAHDALVFFGVAPVRVGVRALTLFGAYWPLVLIGWGSYKVVQRFRYPDRSSVTAPEVVILVWIVVVGLAVRGVERAMEALSSEVSADDFAFVLGPELLGPAHRAVETETFELGDVSELSIENDRGTVVVRGSDDTELAVRWTKQIHSFSESDAERALSNVALDLTEGKLAVVGLTDERDARNVITDLELRVPRAMSVRITNRRGPVRVHELDGSADVTAVRGDVEIADVSSTVSARTRHAAIRLERIGGAVVAHNRHGSVRAVDVTGDVRVESGHGVIALEDISGSATLELGHGSVRIRDIQGAVSIEGPYSEVSVERVEGAVAVESSHRPVFIYDVSGRVELHSRYARVLVRRVADDVLIENSNRQVHVADVRGSVTVNSEKSPIDVDSVDGSVDIASSYDDVRVSSFGSRLEVRAENADIDVVANQVTDIVTVETTRGDVSLALPSDVSAHVSVATRGGELHSDFAGIDSIDSDERRERRWSGDIGDGSHALTIVTTHGNVALRRVEP